jgi:regulator of replication initiation timing
MESSKRLSIIVEKLERLQQKVQQLSSENDELRAVNKNLSNRLRDWQNDQTIAKQNISEHAPVEIEKQQQEVRATSDQDIRQQIDHYLSEIDKCIEWLREQ